MTVWPKRDPLERPIQVFFYTVALSVVGVFGYRILGNMGIL